MDEPALIPVSQLHVEDRLPSLAEFVGELAAAASVDHDASIDAEMFYVDSIQLELPFELDLVQENGVWQIDAAPPTQIVDTTVMPVLHRVRMTVSLDDGERSIDSVES